ncbi:predicted protein [Plenodomus lingam JN3]|uniref:Predicted protein n=1 Tax=Leptosphaeria maculans (strain JN3 / isolate v23.1.3 / race Av1-4-5-6-7-8) TaxID=985895 RepID=E4ZTP6_LEPMJ|nr:predicted protein [Plenodomus lingam JN3]CBX94606.1 predicted protein [Plenodomus lingam JN3]
MASGFLAMDSSPLGPMSPVTSQDSEWAPRPSVRREGTSYVLTSIGWPCRFTLQSDRPRRNCAATLTSPAIPQGGETGKVRT